MPGVAVGSPRNNGDQKPRGSSGSGQVGGSGDDPLIAALIQKLPVPGTDWSADERVPWLQLTIISFEVACGPKE
jgi:hypothetical protein